MVSTVQRRVGNHSLATTAIVGETVNKQHENLLTKRWWSRRKTELLFPTVVDKTAGTVTLTNNSSTVTGSSTAFAATDQGRYFKHADELFVFKTYTSATEFTLGDLNGTTFTYSGETAAGESYILFTRFYELGAGIADIITVNYKTQLREVSQEFLDAMDTSREGTGDPIYFARGPRNLSGTNDIIRIEVYPRPTSGIPIRVLVERAHVDLAGTSNPIVPSNVIEWYAASDTCWYLAAKTKDDRWAPLADKYEKRGITAEEFEWDQDQKNFGVQQAVRDVGGSLGLGSTDFGLTHDTGDL